MKSFRRRGKCLLRYDYFVKSHLVPIFRTVVVVAKQWTYGEKVGSKSKIVLFADLNVKLFTYPVS